ncbi:hypothetical protein [Amycolatopsis sp. CFH S0078]|uniref:hypothetical protein n=1 Tax=Amycolatopsis sp. CFH S0078 TaxID=1644108 RepID=UPI00106E6040|nr:hypothetical protein [Amycolatopsis sp. CFH S0078]
MPLSSSAQKPPSAQHIQWDGTNVAEIQTLLAGAEPFGWTVVANGPTLRLTGGAHGEVDLESGWWIVGRPYWGTTPPEFALAEVLSDADFQAKYGV